ncbi:hypothetical protein B0H21DRAFT_719751 [Amylocystis lapponica]|nr:hypothetical protein B0H21DRAFT_719751 [Amylocystis lapponica]
MKKRTTPEIWHPPPSDAQSIASKTTVHASTMTGEGQREIWRPKSASVLESREAASHTTLPFRTPPPGLPKPLSSPADIHQHYQPRPAGKDAPAAIPVHPAPNQAPSRWLPNTQAAPGAGSSGKSQTVVQSSSASGKSSLTLLSDASWRSWHDPSSSAGTSRRSSFSAQSHRSRKLHDHSEPAASDRLMSGTPGDESSLGSDSDDWEYYDEEELAEQEEELKRKVSEVRERQLRARGISGEAGKNPDDTRIKVREVKRKAAEIRQREEALESKEMEVQRKEEEIARKEERLRQREEELRGDEGNLKRREEELRRREQQLHRYGHEATRPQEGTAHAMQRTRSGQQLELSKHYPVL